MYGACFPFGYRRAQERVLLHGRAGLDGGGKGNDPENEKNDNQILFSSLSLGLEDN